MTETTTGSSTEVATETAADDDPAGAAFAALLAACARAADVVRNDRPASADAADRASGYQYVSELIRQSLALYADGDGDAPRFVPFSSPVAYHAGPLAVTRIQGGVNPDGLYDFAALSPGRSYRVRGRRGNDCYLSLSFSGGRSGDRPDRTAATFNDQQIQFGDDGDFEIVISAEPHPGNWVPLDEDVTSVIVRQYFLVPLADRVPATLAIEVLDPRPPAPAATATAERLTAAARFIDATSSMYPFPDYPEGNSFGEPLGYTGNSGALGTTDNCYVMGRWDLGPGDQLVVETSPAPARYWSLQIWNRWGQSLTVDVDEDNYARQIINNATGSLEADGSLRIVIGAERADAANWLDTFGWSRGTMIFRYLYPEEAPLRPQTRVLRAAESANGG